MPLHLDTDASALQDPYAPHFVSTYPSGVKHDVWFATGASLHTIIADGTRAVCRADCRSLFGGIPLRSRRLSGPSLTSCTELDFVQFGEWTRHEASCEVR